MWRHPLKRPKGLYSKYKQFLSEEGIEGISEMLETKKQLRERHGANKRRQEHRQILQQRAANKELSPPLVLSFDDLRKHSKLRYDVRNRQVQPILAK
jgi:hypothetical protein